MTSLPLHGANLVLVEIAIVAAGLSGLYVIARAVRSAYRRGRQMADITAVLAEIGTHFRPNSGSSLIDVVRALRELATDQGRAIVELTRYSHDSIHALRGELVAVGVLPVQMASLEAAVGKLTGAIEDREARVRSTDGHVSVGPSVPNAVGGNT